MWAGQVGVTWQGCRCTRSIDPQRLDGAACWRTQCVHLHEYLDLCWTRPGPSCCHGNSERHLELVREEEHYVLINFFLRKLKKNLFLLIANNIRVVFFNDLRWNYWIILPTTVIECNLSTVLSYLYFTRVFPFPATRLPLHYISEKAFLLLLSLCNNFSY